MGLLFLLDEDTSNPLIEETLKGMGHSVKRVPDILPQGAEDRDVARYAEATGAIIITHNGRHFLKILQRRPDRQEGPRYRKAGAINGASGMAMEALAQRLKLFDSLLVREYEAVQEQSDPRVLAEVQRERFVIIR